MAVRLRLRRIGKKKQPQYRLVAAEASGPRDGRFIEALGHYNPRLDPPVVSVNEERALWWLQHGAQPTDTAKSLLVKTGVWEKFTGEPAPVAPALASEPPPVEAPAAADSADREEAAATLDASDQEEAVPPDSAEQNAAAASEEGPPAEEQNVSPGETAGGTEEAAKADN